MSNVVEYPHVEFDQGTGHWIVSGSKVPAIRIYEAHRRGVEFETIFKRYPRLTPAQILSAAAFCYDNAIYSIGDP